MLKLLVVFTLLAIVVSLFSGLWFLYQDRGTGTRTVRALTLRIGLSISLFVLLLISYWLGIVPAYNQ